jgi:hypothetical protein
MSPRARQRISPAPLLFDSPPTPPEPSTGSQGQPPSDPPEVATAAPGYEWEQHLAFRNVFLLHFTDARDRAALVYVGNLWFEMALECADKWPDWPESATRCEMRAVAQDLRHSGAFLASVGTERKRSSLDLEDERLSVMADRWAGEADRIAAEIEAVLNGHIPDKWEEG